LEECGMMDSSVALWWRDGWLIDVLLDQHSYNSPV
jgi:hypothetical protein